MIQTAQTVGAFQTKLRTAVREKQGKKLWKSEQLVVKVNLGNAKSLTERRKKKKKQ